MEPKDCHFGTINPATFQEVLEEYPSHASKIQDLDDQRYETIPSSVAQLDSKPHLELDQVKTLVDWKLAHGTFRPTLKALVASNSAATVASTTKAGFALLPPRKEEPGAVVSVKGSITKLSELRGIGPATASLLLSVFDPQRVPFFSDELFRWCMWDEGRLGWSRPIKYTPKEYDELVARVRVFQERFTKSFATEVAAVDVEKVAYVLGKRGVKIGRTDENFQDAASMGKRKPEVQHGKVAESSPVKRDVSAAKPKKRGLEDSETKEPTSKRINTRPKRASTSMQKQNQR